MRRTLITINLNLKRNLTPQGEDEVKAKLVKLFESTPELDIPEWIRKSGLGDLVEVEVNG